MSLTKRVFESNFDMNFCLDTSKNKKIMSKKDVTTSKENAALLKFLDLNKQCMQQGYDAVGK